MKSKDELINFYFQSAKRLRPPEEEVERIRSLFINNRETVSREEKNKLIESCLLFAGKKAKSAYQRLNRNGFPVICDDLIQSANMGLVRAVETYDGSTKFITHAKGWIRVCIERLIKGDRLVHIPIGVERKSIEVSSLDEEKIGNDGDDYSLLSTIEDENVPQPNEFFDMKEKVRRIDSFLKNIDNHSEIERQNIKILKRYYGYGLSGSNQVGHTLEKIADDMNLTKEGVRKIIKKTTETIKWFLKEKQFYPTDAEVSFGQVESPDWFEQLLEIKNYLEGILDYKDVA